MNVLHIDLDDTWGSKERMAIGDAMACQAHSGKAWLYCRRDSEVALRAQRGGVRTIYHDGPLSPRILKWHGLSVLPRLLRALKADLVHFYDVGLIWPLSYLMYRFSGIPLVLTQVGQMEKFYTGPFYRSLTRRLDLILYPFAGDRDNICSHLNVHPRKAWFCGMAAEIASQNIPSASVDGLFIGAYVSGREGSPEKLRALFRFLLLLNERAGQEVFLKLLSEKSWEATPFYQECRKLVWECEVSSWVIFERGTSVSSLQREVHLWVGLDVVEELEDYTLSAALQGIAFLIPRTNATVDLLQDYPFLGESYKKGDIREMRTKGQLLLDKRDERRSEKSLEEHYGVSSYRKRLLAWYQGVCERRRVYVQRKKKGPKWFGRT